ncbi:MAG: DUF350 domain-containing protein [Cyanobacteriota bacterium]
MFILATTSAALSLDTALSAVFVTTIYAILGAIILIAAYKVFDIINPLDFDKEIANNNISLSIMIAGFFLGMSIIIASAIFG